MCWGYSFSLQGFVWEVFRYYKLGSGQLHPNKWIILFVFDKFLQLIEIEPTINVFRTYYHLVVGADNGNDTHWFFTFTNKPTKAMK